MYQSVGVDVEQYEQLKKDVSSNYETWLKGDDINLSIQWFLHDYGSPLSDSIEVIRSNF